MLSLQMAYGTRLLRTHTGEVEASLIHAAIGCSGLAMSSWRTSSGLSGGTASKQVHLIADCSSDHDEALLSGE
jgi:hypothetical protein